MEFDYGHRTVECTSCSQARKKATTNKGLAKCNGSDEDATRVGEAGSIRVGGFHRVGSAMLP